MQVPHRLLHKNCESISAPEFFLKWTCGSQKKKSKLLKEKIFKDMDIGVHNLTILRVQLAFKVKIISFCVYTI